MWLLARYARSAATSRDEVNNTSEQKPIALFPNSGVVSSRSNNEGNSTVKFKSLNDLHNSHFSKATFSSVKYNDDRR